MLLNRARRAVTYVQATKGLRSLVDRERPPIIATSGPYVARTASDRLLRSSFFGQWRPAAFLLRASLLGVWPQLDVPGFRPVLARGWHGLTSSSRTTGTRLLAAERHGSMRVRMFAQNSGSAHGLLYLTGVRDDCSWLGLPTRRI